MKATSPITGVYSGLPALGTNVYLGIPALGTKVYPGLAAPVAKAYTFRRGFSRSHNPDTSMTKNACILILFLIKLYSKLQHLTDRRTGGLNITFKSQALEGVDC